MALLSNSTSILNAEVLLAKRLHLIHSGTICNDQKAVGGRAIDDKEMPLKPKQFTEGSSVIETRVSAETRMPSRSRDLQAQQRARQT